MMDYQFNNKALLEEALTHPSLTKNKNCRNYERLEFLGDRVLGMVIAEIIFSKYPDIDEGSLAVIQSNLVRGSCVSDVAKTIGLAEMLRLDHGEEMIGGRENPKNLENAMEALIAAIYLDSDYSTVARIVAKWWTPCLEKSGTMDVRDSKSLLQEWAQQRHLPLPCYHIHEQTGPAHRPIFSVIVKIDETTYAIGNGTSKKAAEFDAASKLLKVINNHE